MYHLQTAGLLQTGLKSFVQFLVLRDMKSMECMTERRTAHLNYARNDMLVSFFTVVTVFGILSLALLPSVGAAGVDKRIWGAGASKLSGLIIPGFASTRLRAWSVLDCPYSPLDFNPLDPVWIDVRKVLSVGNCWLKCMMLDPVTQADHPECKSRPDAGLSAITELDPGYITGPASSVWREWVNWCVEFGIEADAIIAVPYDWRLSGPFLEKRDLYFYKLKIAFETARKLKGGPSIVFAHSLGNQVFRYFLEWLKTAVAPKLYQPWLDDHVHGYFAVGAPLLGSSETVKAMLLGVTFGLPIAEASMRLMGNTFGSALWMLPISPLCHAHPRRCDKKVDGISPTHYICDEKYHTTNHSGWPVDVVTVELPTAKGVPAYPEISVQSEPVTAITQCSVTPPQELTFSAHKLADGTFLREMRDYDPSFNVTIDHLYKYYLEDPIFNPLTPWERPPIKNVYCMYGIDLRTEDLFPEFHHLLGPTEYSLGWDHRLLHHFIGQMDTKDLNFPQLGLDDNLGYHLAPSGKPYPENWMITDIIYESEGGNLRSRYRGEVGKALEDLKDGQLDLLKSSLHEKLRGNFPECQRAGASFPRGKIVQMYTSGTEIKGDRKQASGDLTVPYHSLSFCKRWLGPEVNITRVPQRAHDGLEVQEEVNVRHELDQDISPNMTRDPGVKYVTFYEDGSSRPGKKTAVWELDKVDHRNILRSPAFLRELWLETVHSYHPNAKRDFVSKAKREPLRDEDCYWDYGRARCGFPERCEYRYFFGDVHLGQSCRLKISNESDRSDHLMKNYL